MDLHDLNEAFNWIFQSGYAFDLAKAFAQAQQELEYSTAWETRWTMGSFEPGPGEGWLPFAATDDSTGSGNGAICWRRPKSTQERNC